jgi:hypothetical protein
MRNAINSRLMHPDPMLALFVLASTAFILSGRPSAPPFQASHTGQIVITTQFDLVDRFDKI